MTEFPLDTALDIERAYFRSSTRIRRMVADGTHSFTRRRFVAGIAGAGFAGIAGCVGSSTTGPDTEVIQPADPPIERDGTPEEFYYFLEQNGIGVDKLERDGNELYLTYRSNAETTRQSNDEIVVVYEVYKQALIQRGSDVEFLYTEIANPFDGQAHGWGIKTTWIRDYDGREAASANESTSNGGNESAGVDSNTITLWNLINNSKVYGTDGDGVADDITAGNETQK